jgi:hypothetical protein
MTLAVAQSPYIRAKQRERAWNTVRSPFERGKPISVVIDLEPRPHEHTKTRRESEDIWPSTDAFEYAVQQLIAAVQQHAEHQLTPASPAAARRMLTVLRHVLAADSVYPTVSIDEDGALIAEWRAGRFALTIDCPPDSAMSWSFRERGTGVIDSGTSTTPLRQAIRDLSAYVAAENPNWQRLFPAIGTTHVR